MPKPLKSGVIRSEDAKANRGKDVGGGAGDGPANRGAPAGTKKMKFCMYHLQGVCKYTSESCAFAHSMEDMNAARTSRRRPPGHDGPQPPSPPPPAVAGGNFAPAAHGKCAGAWAMPPHNGGYFVHNPSTAADLAPLHNAGEQEDVWQKVTHTEPMFVQPASRALVPNGITTPPLQPDLGARPGMALQPGHLDMDMLAPHFDLPCADATAAARELVRSIECLSAEIAHLKASRVLGGLPISAGHVLQDRCRGFPVLHAGMNFFTAPNPFLGVENFGAIADTSIMATPPGLALPVAIGA